MRKLFYLSIATCALICASAVFNGCSDVAEQRLELDKSSVAKVSNGNGRRIPQSLWRSVASAQMRADAFVHGKKNVTGEELIASAHDDAKLLLRALSSINKVLDAFDVLYDDTLCNDFEPEMEDTLFNVPEQAALSYIKKTHSPDFYRIIRHISKKGYINVDANQIADNKNLSDDEKLRLMLMYIVTNKSEKKVSKFMGKGKTPEEKHDEALESCRNRLIFELGTACFSSPDVRRTAIMMVFKNYSDCCKKADEEYAKNRKK